MTKLTYIHGIPVDEFADRGKQVPKADYINFQTLTEGEMKLVLAMQQADILKSFYPEIKDYRLASDAFRNALYTGIHGPEGDKLSGAANEFVRRIISDARLRRGPAAKHILGRESTLSGPDQPVIDNPLVACGVPPPKTLGLFNNKKIKAWEECVDQNRYQTLLNNKLESSSHHILYNFEKNPNQSPATVATKSVLHKTVIYKWAEITGLSADNIELWVRNGVMRGNAKGGLDPLQPENSIEVLKNVVPIKYANGLGIDPVTIKLLTELITLIIAAAAATKGLIDSLKAKDAIRFQSSVGDIGLPPFGPQESDWLTNGGKTIQQQSIVSSNLLIPVAGAAAAYFLFK
jgi:hypothetical protein